MPADMFADGWRQIPHYVYFLPERKCRRRLRFYNIYFIRSFYESGFKPNHIYPTKYNKYSDCVYLLIKQLL